MRSIRGAKLRALLSLSETKFYSLKASCCRFFSAFSFRKNPDILPTLGDICDEEFKKLVAVSYTGMIVSTRETADMKDVLVSLGVTQINA